MIENKTLQALLDARGITQASLTTYLGLSESQISLLVNGKRRMSLDVAAKLSKIMSISIDSIFFALNFAKRK